MVDPRPCTLRRTASTVELRTAIDALLRSYGVTSAVVCVLTPGAPSPRTVLGFGLADAETHFRLFSGSKLFTAAAVMGLVDRGELALADDVAQLLTSSQPAAAGDAAAATDWSHLRGVTVAHLLSHSSGLRDDSLPAVLATHTPSEIAPSAAQVVSRFALKRVPGAPYPAPASYANINFALLGLIIERRAGRPFRQALRSLVLEPLGSHAAFSMPVGGAVRCATGTIGLFTSSLLSIVVGRAAIARILDASPPASAARALPFATRCVRAVDLDGAAFGGLVGRAADFAPLLELALHTAWAPPPAASAGAPAASAGAPTAELASRFVPPAALEIAAPEPVGIEARAGACLGWKAGACPPQRVRGAAPATLPAARFRNHEGGGGGFTSELRIYLPGAGSAGAACGSEASAGESRADHAASRPLGVCVLLNTWSVDMREPRLAHHICELVRAAHVLGGVFD